jgi:hypothetical protein
MLARFCLTLTSTSMGRTSGAVDNQRKGILMKNLLVLTAALVALAGDGFAQQPTVAPPSEKAVEFVRRQPMPGNPVQVSENLVIGRPIPSNLMLSPIPDSPNYAFAIVNQKRLIIDPKNFVIIQILD